MGKYGKKLFEIPLVEYKKICDPAFLSHLFMLDLDDPLYVVKVFEEGIEVGYSTDKWFMEDD